MNPRRFEELTREESLRRLGSVSVGRIVFTHQALPAVRPVNHLVDNGAIVLRTHPGAALLSAVDSVVAYEADAISEDDHIGWSVVITGVARRLRGASEIERYERLLRPWVPDEMEYVIRIHPELVTGFSLIEDNEALPHGAAP
ncbi:pyridoxamine 5'-phosphate oxidase family protein [Amycolatopsis sp. K13G38]|uniref:Pyridoxamine 5'-phosphate oxidase family protein n=1 Tax=Amycolatopsis acididurans TaxID=2724524 RepID=A0ABX1IX69_9PSEU|nr:pyridoxamine 5'-phosphate oxidase family protein [Amycolatopsis acididurans]NKQ52063.1 pyridoxamine 5'-phosphate oxidase family protein [Amycolatopsis acididurans]